MNNAKNKWLYYQNEDFILEFTNNLLILGYISNII